MSEWGEQKPLANVEAEKALIGAIFINDNVFHRVSETLKASHFALEEHAIIFDAISKQIERGKADVITMNRYFEWSGDLQKIGGAAYLADLAGSAVSVMNAEEYARIISDLYTRRMVLSYANDLALQANSGDIEGGAEALIEAAEAGLSELGSDTPQKDTTAHVSESVGHTVDHIKELKASGGKIRGIPTGLMELDKLLSGLHETDRVIVAGRPSMGKSSLAVSIQRNLAKKEYPSAIMSLEMSKNQLNTRWISQESDIDATLLRDGTYSKDDETFIDQAAEKIKGWPVHVDDSSNLTTAAIRIRARKLVRKHGVKVIVVDHIGLVKPDNPRDSRNNQIAQITKDLKNLARDLNITVIALSQLSRNVESRDDKRPNMGDLRDSGSIEQDADVVIFVYRHHYYLKLEEPIKKEKESEEKFIGRTVDWQAALSKSEPLADLIVAKQRSGETGTIKVHFNGSKTFFGNLSWQNYD